jgi:uncharacterized delta-60 repeat protein
LKRIATISCRVAVALSALGIGAAAPASAAPGDLDPTFGEFGKVIVKAPSGGDAAATDVALQPDGKPVAFGWTGFNRTSSSVFRFLPEGGLDASFGQAGVSSLDFGLWYQTIDAGLLLADGTIVYATSVARDAYHGPLVVLTRLLADGGPDPAFGGGDGVVVSDLPVNGGALDLALAPDGRIVLATGADGGGLLVARLMPDGEPDPSFSVDGVATASVPDAGSARTVVVKPDGGVIAAGDGGRDGGPRSALVSLRSDGEPDPDFGADGVLTTDFGTGRRSAVGELALQPDGRLVLSGILGLRKIRPVVARYTPGGEPDRSFSGDGIAKLGKFGSGASLGAVAIQPDGRIVAGGSTESDLFVARLLPDGRPDRSFSRDGRLRTGLGGNGDAVTSLALQADGKILAAGYRADSGFRSTYYSLAIARYLIGGARHDADADGHRDRRDRCPNLSAVAHRGCPFFEREISLDYDAEKRRFTGSIKGERGACAHAGRIKLVRVKPGADRVLASTQAPEHGKRFTIPAADPSGRFYARVAQAIAGGAGLCGKARSGVIRVSR